MTKVVFDRDDFENRMQEALDRISIRLMESLKMKLSKEHGKDTGFLQANIKVKRVGLNEVEVTIPGYGKYVEWGTPPHMPPVEALEGWAMRKWGDKKLAWSLAMHIKKFGTRPYPFIRPTFENELIPIVVKSFKEVF